MPEIPDSLMRLLRHVLGTPEAPPQPERVSIADDPLVIAARRTDRVEAEAWAVIERGRQERERRMDPAAALRLARQRREEAR